MHLCVHYWWLWVTIFSIDIWNGMSIWLYTRNRCFNHSTNSLSVGFLLSVRHWEFSFCIVKAVHGGIVLKLCLFPMFMFVFCFWNRNFQNSVFLRSLFFLHDILVTISIHFLRNRNGVCPLFAIISGSRNNGNSV